MINDTITGEWRRSVMPFSMVVFSYIKKIKIVTLQVRILMMEKSFLLHMKRREKKACRSVSASMTLEAVLTLSLLIFASVSLILPMKIMTTQRRIQAGLESAGENLSKYGYLAEAIAQKAQEKIPGADESDLEFGKKILETAVVIAYGQSAAMEKVDTEQVQSVSMLHSSVAENGSIVDLVMDYEIKMPFPVLGLKSIRTTARSRRRVWTGKSGLPSSSGEGKKEEEDQIVYVGKGSTRYHLSRECHYLSSRLTAVPFEVIGEKRNINGGKYGPCAVCGEGAGPGSSVYIAVSGSSYHTTRGCRSLIAYVRAVHLSEVKHLGACSYCGKN